ncbi:LppM family (lipo)protein [Gordonia sp. (in: high G+C Gram-positive bacteria)]|uniref:LppM family (lipo)protein n=1 Tax=Gordonia sp. (in: high G+C Gram-positive bacteria) TaxID=84139 RepID=UPI0039E3993B
MSHTPTRPSLPRLAAALGAALLLIPLLSGCLTRSTTVGDRFSGEIIVATSSDNPNGVPRLDVPQSMSSQVTLSDFTGTISGDGTVTMEGKDGQQADPKTPKKGPTKVGTRALYSNLTAGQFGQLGDIVAASFTGSGAALDISTKRSGDAVRLTGTADLNDLVDGRDAVYFTVRFAGDVTGTNGIEQGDKAVAWVIPAGKSSDLNADARYADPASAALPSWSFLVALLCLLAVGAVAWYARREHLADTTPRPGAPAK